MQFQVPQFIEEEDKIFGPLTLKQFFYVLGGGATIFILYALVRPMFLMFLLAIPVAIFFGMLAFYKVNSQPFIKTVENFVSHYTRTRLFLWRKADGPEIKQITTAETAKKIGSPMPKLTESKLKELAWSLDIQKPPRRI